MSQQPAESGSTERGVAVQCSRCTVAALEDPGFELVGTTAPERIGYLLQLAARRGWRVFRCGAEASVVCPACVKAQEDPPAPPPYCHRGKCAKCGGARVATRYDAGTSPLALHPREHLDRTCGRCGYRWPESCNDYAPAAPAPPEQPTPPAAPRRGRAPGDERP